MTPGVLGGQGDLEGPCHQGDHAFPLDQENLNRNKTPLTIHWRGGGGGGGLPSRGVKVLQSTVMINLQMQKPHKQKA